VKVWLADRFWPSLLQRHAASVIQKNYGMLYHERISRVYLKHVAESGDVLYTVRVGSSRLVSTDWIRDVCAHR